MLKKASIKTINKNKTSKTLLNVFVLTFIMFVIGISTVYALSYTVSYNNNTGSGTMSDSTYTSNPGTLRTNTFTKSGYKFMGWNKNSGATSDWYRDTNSFTGTDGSTTTLYAQWCKNSQGTIKISNNEVKDTYGNYVFRNNKYITVKADNKTITYGGTPSYSYTVTGTLNGETGVTGTATYTVKNGSTTITPSSAAVGSYTIYVSGLSGATGYSIQNTNTGTLTITAQKCNTPTNVAVSTAGRVTWTASSNCSSAQHQVSMDGTNWTNATSGYNYLSTIIAATGTRTVRVRAVAPNANYTTSDSGTGTATVYTITFASNDTNKGTVSPTSYNVISGATVEVSSNNLLVKGITSGSTTTTLATIVPTNKTGYHYDNWSKTSGSLTSTQTITATFTGNTYTIGYTLNGGNNPTTKPTSGTYGSDVQISNPTKTCTVNINANSQGATITDNNDNTVTSVSTNQTFSGWTSTTLGSNAKTGTSANPSTAWTGTSTTNTYFKNLRESGTATMVANWNNISVVLPNIEKTGHICGYATSASGAIVYSSGQTYTDSTTCKTSNSGTPLYAKCDPSIYTLTANTIGGTTPTTTGWTIHEGTQSSGEHVSFIGKKIIIIGENDGVPSIAINDTLTSAGADIIASLTDVDISQSATGAMSSQNQSTINSLVQQYGASNVVVILGTADTETASLFAETVTNGDPTLSGPLTGVSLGLAVYHIFEEPIKNSVDPDVYEEQIGMMEQVSDVDDLVSAVEEIRDEYTDYPLDIIDGSDGTETIMTKDITYNAQYGTLPTTTKIGNTFNGWNTARDGNGTTITNTTIVSIADNHTIYAQWTEKIKKVSFIKRDEVTHAPIQGIVFNLTGTDYKGEDISLSATSSYLGIVEFNLPVGEYQIQEYSSVGYYLLNQDIINVIVPDN